MVELVFCRGETIAVIGAVTKLLCNGVGSLCISSSCFLTFMTVCEMRGVVTEDVPMLSCSERKSTCPWLMVSLPSLSERVMMFPCFAFWTAKAKTAVISSLAMS